MTVKAGATNQAPVAQGTIPGVTLQIGGSATRDAAGYFNDADGDELTYAASSSDETVATVSIAGSTATITGVAAGDATVTITASDGNGGTAAQGFSVSVQAAPANNAPVAVGTIPASSLEIGQSSSPLDVSGYFSDADGDELTYTGSSSNEAVATVAMDGSEATITAVAAGNAVITISASDGEASVSQGFSVTVNAGPKPATVSIFGVQDLSGGSVDPTSVSGNVNVLVNYESNDEVVVGIELLIDDYAMHCRGSTGSGESDLAGSGSQVEIPCLFNTAAVMGECSGAQMAPMFSNGEVVLGARLHTQGGDTRDALATQAITLKNSNYVMVGHSAGSNHVLIGGMPLYGGSSEAEGNMNSFSACPVAFDGTTVGKMSLRAMQTGPGKAGLPGNDPMSLSFMEKAGAGAATDRERADGFTWDVNSAWNGHVEDKPGAGGREHWVFAGETIENADGLDVSGDFETGMPGGMSDGPWGPFHFDFKAPVPGAIHIGGAAVPDDGPHYSDKPISATMSNSIKLSSMTDMGAGVDDASIMIAVGDCSAAANLYDANTKMPDRTMTPFDAEYASVSHISELAEEDATRDGPGKDSNGLDCYVAELTSLADKLGNAWSGDKTPASWLQTANFGVDKTAAVLSDIEPDDQGLVFKVHPKMEFEVDNPKLASGDAGTDLGGKVWSGSGADRAEVGDVNLPTTGRQADVELDATAPLLAMEGAKSVTVIVSDGAMPPNRASYTLNFRYDKTPATYAISRSQGDIGRTGAPSVQVSVAGTISDASVIKTAALRLLLDPNADGVCNAVALTDADTLPTARLTGGYKRNLENGTKSITFDATFTIKPPDTEEQGTGPEDYCFRLDVEDEALEADARGDGNMVVFDDVGSFNVAWPAGPTPPPPPPPGPTFEFLDLGDATATPAVDPAPITAPLEVTEGATDATSGTKMYSVKLANVDAADLPTAAAPLTVTLTGSPGVRTFVGGSAVTTLTFPNATDATRDTVNVEVRTAHDLDITSDPGSVTHSATGYDDASLAVVSNDDDFEITADVASIEEDDAATEVTVTVTAGTATDADRTVTVTLGYPSGDAETTPAAATSVDVTIDAEATSGEATVDVDALDDIVQDEMNEEIALTGPQTVATTAGYYKGTSIAIVDNDPDVTTSLMVDGVATDQVSEAAGTVTVTITATADAPVDGITTFSFTQGGAVNSGTDYTDPGAITLTINTGETTASVDVTLVITDDSNVEGNEILELLDADGASDGTRTWSIQTAKLTIIDNDSN